MKDLTQKNDEIEDLPCTGERYIPSMKGDMQLEHLHRYAIASEYVKDKVVLDIACGEGYGSAMLSSVAEYVFGVDISLEAVNYARNKYRSDKIEFKVGSCAEIPLPDKSVDAIVSFETIEHLAQHDAMMAELKRVLKSGGILIISSPDKQNYSDIPKYKNPFHVKELYYDEFKLLLESYFNHVTILGQRIIFGSGIFGSNHHRRMVTYDFEESSNSNFLKACFEGIAKPRYLIAVASDVVPPESVGSILEQPVQEGELFLESITVKEDLISQKNIIITKKDQLLTEGEAKISEKEQKIAVLEKALSQNETILEKQNKRLVDAKRTIAKQSHAITVKEESISKNEAVIAEKTQLLVDAQETIAEKEQAIAQKDNVIAEMHQVLERVRTELESNRKDINQRVRQIQTYREELYSVYTSKSWRYTLPMRKMGTLVRRVLFVPHKPWLRAKIKRAYFLLPSPLRRSSLIDRLKNRFKQSETPRS